ncbi:uncharacterized protein APUU_51327A [Aspergillus puulaauensis]|uniref:Uncharacterized protein n=1 Tax=Aspergillus puulaauensis TaxID=1220207 RepID=A0A7R7XS78_9EURO|nr:uncharacterized protein APUU_51327A [Aspergillus puulaauensis]BCS26616.1 hypothetical protein APUU_51327A [Aspergillus puulaauensis]
MARRTVSEGPERNAMELPKYPGSCASREQPPPYIDVDLEQQHSTDPPGYQNGSPTRDSNRNEASESNICLGVWRMERPTRRTWKRPCSRFEWEVLGGFSILFLLVGGVLVYYIYADYPRLFHKSHGKGKA